VLLCRAASKKMVLHHPLKEQETYQPKYRYEQKLQYSNPRRIWLFARRGSLVSRHPHCLLADDCWILELVLETTQKTPHQGLIHFCSHPSAVKK